MMRYTLQPNGSIERLIGSRRTTLHWERAVQPFYILMDVAGHKVAREHVAAFRSILEAHWQRPTATITDEEIRTWLAFERQKISASAEAPNEEALA